MITELRKILPICLFPALIFLVMPGRLAAQFIPNSSQAFQLAPAYNPAFSGVEPFTSVRAGYRSQWSSFPGAPRFLNLVASGRVGRQADVNHNALRSGALIKTDDIPRAQRLVHGLGGNLLQASNGSQGIIENLEGGVNYALHYPLNKGYFLAMGVGAYYGSIRIRWDRLQLEDPDQFVDRAQASSYSNISVRGGLLLYSPKWYVHAAYLQLYSDTNTGELTDIGYRYQATGGLGVTIPLSATIELRPSVWAFMDEFENIDIDYAVKLYYGSQAWGGLSYRDNGFAALTLGFEVNSLVGFSYSYEISTGALQGFNNGSNEFMVGLKLANFRKLNPYVW